MRPGIFDSLGEASNFLFAAGFRMAQENSRAPTILRTFVSRLLIQLSFTSKFKHLCEHFSLLQLFDP